MERKSFLPQIKRTDEGSALIVFATMNAKDHDADVPIPGVFGDQVVPVVGAHGWQTYTIGKALVKEVGTEAIADIKFNDTDLGVNWYKSIRFDWNHPPPKQQYSWAFQLTPEHFSHGEFNGEKVRFLTPAKDGTPLEIIELSPVLRGAGVNTRSVDVKADKEPSFEELDELKDLLEDLFKQEGVRVQTLIFAKSKWDSAEAVRSWLRSHDFKTSLADFENTWHAEQLPSERFVRLRSFCINPSRSASPGECRVMARGGPLKESRQDDEADPDPEPPREQKGGTKLADALDAIIYSGQEYLEQVEQNLVRLEQVKSLRAETHRPMTRDRLDQVDRLLGPLQTLLARLSALKADSAPPVVDTEVQRELLDLEARFKARGLVI